MMISLVILHPPHCVPLLCFWRLSPDPVPPSVCPLTCSTPPRPHLLTSTEDALRCQVVSQPGQVGILPVVQLPARDAQVEP